MIGAMKAKDVFSIMEVHHTSPAMTLSTENTSLPQEVLRIQQSAVDWVTQNFNMLMPEEVLLALKLSRSAVFAKPTMAYLTSQLNMMEVQEAAKIFFALTQKRGALSIKDSRGEYDLQVLQFLAFMGNYFRANLERFDDKSMAFVLSLLANSPPVTHSVTDVAATADQSSLQKFLADQEDNGPFLPPEEIRKHVLRVLNQQNFEVRNFTTILGAAFDIMSRPEHNNGVERKDLPCREDLEFWLKCCTFIPRLNFTSQSQVVQLQNVLMDIDKELMELDFSRLIHFLEEKRIDFTKLANTNNRL